MPSVHTHFAEAIPQPFPQSHDTATSRLWSLPRPLARRGSSLALKVAPLCSFETWWTRGVRPIRTYAQADQSSHCRHRPRRKGLRPRLCSQLRDKCKNVCSRSGWIIVPPSTWRQWRRTEVCATLVNEHARAMPAQILGGCAAVLRAKIGHSRRGRVRASFDRKSHGNGRSGLAFGRCSAIRRIGSGPRKGGFAAKLGAGKTRHRPTPSEPWAPASRRASG